MPLDVWGTSVSSMTHPPHAFVDLGTLMVVLKSLQYMPVSLLVFGSNASYLIYADVCTLR